MELHASLSFLMRMMEVGDRLLIPIERWGTARFLASSLKKDYGVKYTVKKLRDGHLKYDYIVITRVL